VPYQNLFDASPPGSLWGGPYPLSFGNVSPSQVKIWFNTVASELLVWQTNPPQWIATPTSYRYTGNGTPSSHPLGTIYVDPTMKLWMSIDDWRELTFPLPGGPTPTLTDNSPFAAGTAPPQNPTNGTIWFEPSQCNAFVWNGFTWVQIGMRPVRQVRTPNWLGTWNAGGNRTQGIAAGDLLYVAGMRGIDPVTQQQVAGPGAGGVGGADPTGGLLRNTQIWSNIKVIVEAEGINLNDCYGITTAVTNIAYLGVTVQAEALPQFYGIGPYPPRTHEVWLQMSGSDNIAEFPITGWPVRGDITEVTSMFFLGQPGVRKPTMLASEIADIPGVQIGTM
jgi:hypothetical protein